MSTNTKTRNGRIPQKRGDTLIGNIEKKYGVDLGHRSDKKLATVLRETGATSLSKLLRMADSSRRK